MTTACALAGILTLRSTDISTLTWVPSGVTSSIVPTSTPSTRTVEPA
jgi:hypothetical protein